MEYEFDDIIYDYEDNEYEVRIVVTGFHSGYAGRYDGPWEDCYPDEPPEVEFDVYCEGKLRNDLYEFADYEDILDKAEKHYKELWEII